MKKAVGFDQKITVSQLDTVVSLYQSDMKKEEFYKILNQALLEEIKGEKSRKNVITILMKIWVLVEPDHRWLRDAALKLYLDATKEERLALHWGMVLLAYPFFRECTENIGRQFRLNGNATSQKILARIKSIYGDRRRVEVSLSAVLSTLRSFQVIDEEKKTVLCAHEPVFIMNEAIGTWLGAVSLYSQDKAAIPLNARNDSSIFPFDYQPSAVKYRELGLPLVTQGLDSVYVCRKETT